MTTLPKSQSIVQVGQQVKHERANVSACFIKHNLLLRAVHYSIAILLLSVAGFAVNVKDLPGIDCSGRTDSSAALNVAFQNLSNSKLVIPSGCQIRSDQPLTIQGQESFVIEGEGDRPITPGGPAIFGCNGSSGAVLTINRSGFWTLKGFGIYTRGPKPLCTQSSFTRSLDINNSGTGGSTTTHGVIEHMALTIDTQGGSVPGYVGVNIIGQPNTEHIVLRDNWIHCQNSPGSVGISVRGLNSDNDLSDGNSISDCNLGIQQGGGNIRIVGNHLNGNGNFSVFGVNGAAIWVSYCTSGPMFIAYNEVSDGGPFFNSNNDTNGGCLRGITMIGNYVGISDIGPNQYPVNLGTVSVPYVLIGNDFHISPTKTSKNVIGSDSQNVGYPPCTNGPNGILIDIGNYNSFPANTGGWSGCAGVDFQAGHVTSNNSWYLEH